MTSLVGNRNLVGNVTDFLFSALFTTACASKALNGLNKINAVFGRGVKATLLGIGWDTSAKDSWAKTVSTYVSTSRFGVLFEKDVHYDKLVQAKDDKGQLLFLDEDKKQPKMEYEYSNLYLVGSGLALSTISLTAFVLKNAIWRETSPLLNVVLRQFSPLQLVVDENSYIASAINAGVGAALSKIGY
jgi:hypothetical protein